MPVGGALQISYRQRKLNHACLLYRLSGGDGEREREVVELSFKDEGAGMPGEIRKQIFDPFFTTKARGTGLGLSIVHNIMESHRAVIDVESAARQGTTFVLMFPTV